jgi:hypothetical protein
MYKDLEAIKAANLNSGSRFFEPGTLAWWKSRVSSKIWPVADGAYFVTSERCGDDPRMYTVRFVDAAGDINTVGGFREHATMAEAQMYARGAADGHHIPVADA